MCSLSARALALSIAAALAGCGAPAIILAPPSLADVIAVRGDPTTDASALERAVLVVRGGRIVRNDVAPIACAPSAR